MRNKLLLFGGVSAAGKTAICNSLEEHYGIENRRVHNYVLEISKGHPLDEIVANWDSFLPDAFDKLIADTKAAGALTCDVHFAVQPEIDTAYALNHDYVEDINMPYVKGIGDSALKLKTFSEIDFYMFLISPPKDTILRRRKNMAKKPRSLCTDSIKKEMEFETRYFHEAAHALKHTTPIVNLIRNKQGHLESTVKKIAKLCNIGDGVR